VGGGYGSADYLAFWLKLCYNLVKSKQGVSQGGSPMDMQEKYGYWLDHALYDMETAESMFKTRRWLYVAFMCQQALEKLIKGLYGLYLDFDTIPRSHNIRWIVSLFAEKLPEEIPENILVLFESLAQYYFSNRYPDYVDQLLKRINEAEARRILAESKEVFTWLQTMKP
jgi:HEPN domain-containing protein